jgi:hypothetical protein
MSVLVFLRQLLGLPSKEEITYAKPERLTDVMALIQVLALDKYTHRTEKKLREEMQQDVPNSGSSWTEVARQHPEFFRVNPKSGHPVSLVSRHVMEKEPNSDRRPSLDGRFVESLLASAIDIHDRQVRRSEKWTILIPVWVALVTGAIALIK